MISFTTGARICLRAFWPRAPRLKLTTILITVGFPVTISCIWSTFDLKKKESVWNQVRIVLSALDTFLGIKQTITEHHHHETDDGFVLKSQYSNKLQHCIRTILEHFSGQMRQETDDLCLGVPMQLASSHLYNNKCKCNCAFYLRAQFKNTKETEHILYREEKEQYVSSSI